MSWKSAISYQTCSLINCRYDSPVTFPSKKKGLITPLEAIPAQHITPGLFRSFAITSWGFSADQKTQLWRLTWPFSLKVASSVHNPDHCRSDLGEAVDDRVLAGHSSESTKQLHEKAQAVQRGAMSISLETIRLLPEHAVCRKGSPRFWHALFLILHRTCLFKFLHSSHNSPTIRSFQVWVNALQQSRSFGLHCLSGSNTSQRKYTALALTGAHRRLPYYKTKQWIVIMACYIFIQSSNFIALQAKQASKQNVQ